MLEVELVQVRVDVDSLRHRLRVVLAAGQRGQDREFEDVERQLALDDLDALDQRFLRVVGEADDIAAIGDAAALAPLEQKLAIVGNVVLLLLRRGQIIGVDVLEADEYSLDARRHRLLDEAGNLVAGRVDLDDEARVDALRAQFDQPVEDRFPVAIAGEIVVGDEEIAHAVGDIDPHQLLDVIGRAIARLAPLHVDDGAEGAEEGTAASGVEARDHAERAAHPLRRHVGAGRAFKPRQIVEVIVDGLQLARRRVAQDFVEPSFRFARIERNAEVERRFERIRRLRQHGETAGDMESADDHRHARRPKRPGAIHHPRELIRLHADESDHAEAAVVLYLAGDSVHPDTGVGLVDGEDLDVHVRRRGPDLPCISARCRRGRRANWKAAPTSTTG